MPRSQSLPPADAFAINSNDELCIENDGKWSPTLELLRISIEMAAFSIENSAWKAAISVEIRSMRQIGEGS